MPRAAVKTNAGLALICLLSLLLTLSCKKNPTTPDAEELTRPIIWLDSTQITFTAYQSGGNPSPQSFKIKNSGKNKLDYAITDDADWLSVEPAGGSSTGQVLEHSIIIEKSGLAARDAPYSATITINSAAAYNNPQKISVSLKISKEPPPTIWASPAEMTFSTKVGKSPASQILKVKNSGQGTLDYAVTWDAAWLNVTPTSGSSRGEEKSHTVSVNSSGLAEGTYSGLITVADSYATNNPLNIKVTLSVSKEMPPVIGLSTSQISFSATVGQNPSPKSFGVRNSGEGTLSYQITWDAGWLFVSPASGSSSGQENSHSVSVSSAGLGTGKYSGMITVTSATAANSPQYIGVTLDVINIPTDNAIYINCNPSSGGTGTIVSVPISIKGNINQISTLGLDMVFESGLFQYQGTGKGNLTSGWAMVDGNQVSPGTVRIGGFAGSASPIAVGSTGSIAGVTLKVIGTSYNDGYQSRITIRGYTDDIAGMRTDPYTIIFTFRK
jgi:hypothetical protein